ncbi:leukocyte cysteine proteinase inhibitor 1 [Etheostoma spectabile]|uniref:Cystatin domain-containing protein n=1 Tax=Etheostoma spectabile TaxID=54343 RepID=A0A5J5CFU4_9PERO|nr:leukocyte cysteine proteinase inhibitor 1-like [Etheostoma spectabile]KAA8580744.1 hypothetical protein FQN60_013702 [Etheostoma spectabile]
MATKLPEAPEHPVKLGGQSKPVDATKDIQKICDQVKGQVEVKTKKKYVKFTAVNYTSQSTNPPKLRIKVHTGGVNYIHLLVTKAFRNGKDEIELLGQQENRTKNDILV